MIDVKLILWQIICNEAWRDVLIPCVAMDLVG